MHCSRLVGGLAALAALLILLAAPAALAATLTPVWSGDYTTSGNDGFNAVATGPDGAVYAAGYAQAKKSGADSQLLLVKYVGAGASLIEGWHVLAGNEPMRAAKVGVDAAGNVIVAGTQGPIDFRGRGSDIVVMKVSSAGRVLWRTTYDGLAHRLDYVNDMALDATGNAFVVGASGGRGTGRDYVTIKVRPNGSRAWVKRYAGPDGFDEARGVAVSGSGTVFVTGWSDDKKGARRAYTISYGPGGVKRWAVRDTTRKSWSGAADVMLSTAPGAPGVVITGYQGAHGGHEVLMFAKYSASNGKVVWKRLLPNGAQATEPAAGAIDGTGAPVAVGMTNLTSGISGYIAGVSSSGGDAWHSALVSEFTDPGEAQLDAVAASAAGGILAGGWTQAAKPAKRLWDFIPTAFAVRYTAARSITAPLDYVGPGGQTSRSKCTAVAIGASGMYAVGEQTGAAGDQDAVLVKF